MNEIKEKMEELKSCIGKTDDESRAKFNAALEYLKENDSPEVQALLCSLLGDGLNEVKAGIGVLKSQIEDVYPLLPLSYIAEHYFGKSRAWLYQRLNGYEVRGKVYTLNESEKQIFNQAVKEIAEKIGSVQLS